MLTIKINNSSIMPMRPDAPNTFGSNDVPHGTDSCIVKAIKVYNSNGNTPRIPVPSFTEEEVAEMIETQKANIVMLPLLDEEGEAIDYTFVDVKEDEILEPTEDEVGKEFYEVFPAEMGKELVAKKVTIFDPMMNSEVQKYVDLAAAKEALIEAKKQESAERIITRKIDECILVPELDEDFKAQFELIEVAEI